MIKYYLAICNRPALVLNSFYSRNLALKHLGNCVILTPFDIEA